MIVDLVQIAASGFLLVLFRFGFSNPFPDTGEAKRTNTAWYYIYVAAAYLIFASATWSLLAHFGVR